jgi:hypothetical protein
MNLVRFHRIAAAAALIVGLSATAALAGDCGCERCGCASDCKMVTRIVCTTKKEKKTIWACQCADVCFPRPSECGLQCGCPCDCNADKPMTCGKVYSVKKLMKKEIEVEVPVAKCVVEYLCAGCEAKCGAQESHSQGPPMMPAASRDQVPPRPPVVVAPAAHSGLKYPGLERAATSPAGAHPVANERPAGFWFK